MSYQYSYYRNGEKANAKGEFIRYEITDLSDGSATIRSTFLSEEFRGSSHESTHSLDRTGSRRFYKPDDTIRTACETLNAGGRSWKCLRVDIYSDDLGHQSVDSIWLHPEVPTGWVKYVFQLDQDGEHFKQEQVLAEIRLIQR